MKDKPSIYERIDRFLEKSKIPTAYILFIYITAVQYVPDEWISKEFKEISLLPVAITLGVIILRIFFEIYRKINEPAKTLPYYKNWNKLIESDELLKAFDKRLRDDKIINIKIVGISLRFYWDYLRNLIEEYLRENKNYQFNIDLAILDPDYYDEAEFVDEDFKNKFYHRVKGTISDIELFKKKYSDDDGKSKCNINIYKYRFLPSFYGISLDDKFLFVGNTFWDKNILSSSGNAYNVYKEDDEFSGSERILMFNSWLDYIKNKN